MSNKAGKRLVPELRFPEFGIRGNWKIKELRGFFNLDESVEKPLSFDKEKLITVKLHGAGVIKNDRAGNLSGGANYFVRRSGQFIFSKIDLLNGAFGIVPEELDGFSSSSDVPAYSFFSLASSLFFNYWLLGNYKKLGVERVGTSSTLRRVSPKDFLDVKSPTPELDEQEKIANCLSSLDDLITAQAKKIEIFKAHKKGLMQQLFPAEGEAVPRLRFPEFRGAGAWEEQKAEKLFANRVEKGESGLPIYSVTMNDGMVKRASLDRDFDDIADPKGNKKAHRRDIAYNMMRMWQGASGVAVENCMVSPAYVVLAPRKEVNSVFFGYLFKLPKYLKKLTSHSYGLTLDRLRLYYKDFAEIPLLYPSMQEQKRIADCLYSIDELISVHVEILKALKAQKQGLMQALFPSLNEAEE